MDDIVIKVEPPQDDTLQQAAGDSQVNAELISEAPVIEAIAAEVIEIKEAIQEANDTEELLWKAQMSESQAVIMEALQTLQANQEIMTAELLRLQAQREPKLEDATSSPVIVSDALPSAPENPPNDPLPEKSEPEHKPEPQHKTRSWI